MVTQQYHLTRIVSSKYGHKWYWDYRHCKLDKYSDLGLAFRGRSMRPKKLFCESINLNANQFPTSIMGKKRKAGGRPASKNEAPARTRFDVEERFDDSEDEFQTGRDKILLEEAPEAKRRRRVAEDGMSNAAIHIQRVSSDL